MVGHGVHRRRAVDREHQVASRGVVGVGAQVRADRRLERCELRRRELVGGDTVLGERPPLAQVDRFAMEPIRRPVGRDV